MNAPAEKVTALTTMVLLRKDLSLQIVVGDQELDVQLMPVHVLELAGGCFSALHDRQPWGGRAEATALEDLNSLCYMAVRLQRLLLKGAQLSENMAVFLARESHRCRVAVQMVDESITHPESNDHTKAD